MNKMKKENLWGKFLILDQFYMESNSGTVMTGREWEENQKKYPFPECELQTLIWVVDYQGQWVDVLELDYVKINHRIYYLLEDAWPCDLIEFDGYYWANALNQDGQSVRVFWEIVDNELIAEDCCNWDNPSFARLA